MKTRKRIGRPAFTLLELLVAMSISLVMLYAMILFLRYVGDTVSDGRSMIEISGQLRAVRQRLHDDLAALSLPVRPLADAGGAPGYFMYYEGPASDTDRNADGNVESDSDADGTADDSNAGGPTPSSLALSPWGDFDDILAFTIYSKDEPLVGRGPNGGGGGQMVTADSAEVIWYCGWNDSPLGGTANIPDDNEMRFLFRRQLLVDPSLVLNVTGADVSSAAGAITYPFGSKADAVNGLINYQQKYDISVRIEFAGSGQWILKGNTLADLARRENRYAHFWNQTGNSPADGFPNPLNLNPVNSASLQTYVLQGDRLGEDIQLSRCIAWDVRVFDAGAAVIQGTVDAAGPSDRIVANGSAGTIATYGAFVDLNYSRYTAGTSLFSESPATGSQLGGSAIYDTWSVTYERDGIDQDGNGIVDQQTNGYDDNNQGGVDDATERETVPPYSTPLRGIQVLIRVFDPSSKQMQQATVVGDFMPE